MTFNASLTPVLLANMALSKLGNRSTIGSLSENSPEGNQCRLWYKQSLAQTLAAFNWNFARATIALTEHSFDPPDNWSYRYELHPSVLTPRYLKNPAGPDADSVPYTIEYTADGSLSLLTDLEDAELVYTIDLTDDQFIGLFPPHFINAFTSCLAANMAFTLTGSMPLESKKQQEFAFYLNVASAIDGNSTVADKPREAEAIRGRT